MFNENKKETLEEAFLCAKYAKEMLLSESLFYSR